MDYAIMNSIYDEKVGGEEGGLGTESRIPLGDLISDWNVTFRRSGGIGEKLDEKDRFIVSNELFVSAIGIFVLAIVCAIYHLFEIHITRKYQNTLDTPPEFIPVRNQEPPRPAGPKLSLDQPHCGPPPPPPPYNPLYR
ncbi:unnamed protein product [Gongylonema pulchrum]|uniref:Transmembrane protein n=1 Tax=Gongylonema pulchrum TaxID=637853 RepID=A0A183E3L2_9BILA|nr:unnamed protein product [Gongylonema pulchrum]